ncbi:MAG: MltA domain-containing protein [Desulfobacterales bacterium]|nr:MAG: MltA domain-containing protein [Desulfobacterales bacterium]
MRSEIVCKYLFIGFAAAASLFILGACTLFQKEPTPENAMKRISGFFQPAFSDDLGYEDLEQGLLGSLEYLRRIPESRIFQFGRDRFSAAHMIRSLEHFRTFIQTKPSAPDLKNFIGSNYRVYRSRGRDGWGRVLFTGYYEPLLEGRRTPTPEYRFPVYARPQDLITVDLSLFSEKYKGQKIIARIADQTVVPYYDRREIDSEGVLHGKAETLAWVKDPVDIFFLQIQGSGRIRLDDGQVLNVHYHASNGRPYRSIGRLLIEQNKIPRSEMSMQQIRAYLRAHPDEIETIFNYNPSYVFFKLESDGPLGSLGVKLTPGRSVALDRRLFPPAALAFIVTQKPRVNGAGQIDSWTDCTRFVTNQDTGGAIRGPGRADLFWGHGAYAETAAGHMQQEGRLYFLILKPEKS